LFLGLFLVLGLFNYFSIFTLAVGFWRAFKFTVLVVVGV